MLKNIQVRYMKFTEKSRVLVILTECPDERFLCDRTPTSMFEFISAKISKLSLLSSDWKV